MSSVQFRPSMATTWDGRRLRMRAAPGARLGVSFDGSCFCELAVDDSGTAELDLPFSPSGQDTLDLCVEALSGPDAIEADHLVIAIGTPGSQSARGARQPLRALMGAGQTVADAVEPMRREVAVVVPVYNAAAGVRRCLDSVIEHSTGPCRLIVIDDASTDPDIDVVLDRYRMLDGVEILANASNLGFTATVNRGIRLAGRADVVLLNADTEVAAQWLTGLRRAAYCAADVATATAVSDNAGAFSVPELERENPIPACWTFAQAARALWQDAGLAYPQLPTGNGFCLYVRREVFDAVGLFDVEAFPQGYGEENDFCQRASAHGFRHLVAGNVFVAHARSQSFGVDRRESLGRAGMQVLRARWPHYETDVGATLFSFERRVLDWRVRRIHAMASQWTPRPRLLRLGPLPGVSPASAHDEWMITAHGNQWHLTGPDSQPVESIPAADFGPAWLARWLQCHAIELVEFGPHVDPSIADALQVQAVRLGVPILKAADDAGSTEARRSDAMSSLRRFVGARR